MRTATDEHRGTTTALHPSFFGEPRRDSALTVTDLIDAQCVAHPDLRALEHGERHLSYGELDAAATTLTARLRELGVGPGDIVGVFLRRSIEMVVAIVAILRTGAAYAPQDARIAPPTQLEAVARTCAMRLALTTTEFVDVLPDGVRALTVDALPTAAAPAPTTAATATTATAATTATSGCAATAADPCAVIFTSGTTGQPNGVVVTHRNLVNLLDRAPGNLGIAPGDRVGQILNIAFDMAAWEILGALCNGGTLVIRGADIAETAEAVDVLIATPSIVGTLSSARARARTVVVAGERCPQPLADEWATDRAFLTSCGPTEITIVNTLVRHVPGTPVTIGAPLPGTSVYVLDDRLRPVAPGEVGEMWAGGVGITDGYLGNDALTAERYRPDPFAPEGGRMFRTRDLGRWTPEGLLEHLGRTDDQVKVRGFRVELDSVARALERASSCRKAVVVQLDARSLGAVLTPADADVEAARAAVAEALPYYCEPRVILTLDELPLTDRGKVDRARIRSLLDERAQGARAERAA